MASITLPSLSSRMMLSPSLIIISPTFAVVPAGVGDGVGVVVGDGLGLGVGVGDGLGLGVGVSDGLGVGVGVDGGGPVKLMSSK